MRDVPARHRNLHEERSEETRARLLEATIDSLVAVGYARTSTAEIADRAGVSRTAWIYHYSTKAALVAAAVERLLERRRLALPELYEAFRRTADSPASAVELLAQSFEGPMFFAWLELAVASRTDEDLRAQLARLSLRFAETLTADLRRLFPAISANFIFEHGDFALALMDGIFLTRILYADEERFRRMISTLARIAERAQPSDSNESSSTTNAPRRNRARASFERV
jgi:AcrR family transcriptional regulator